MEQMNNMDVSKVLSVEGKQERIESRIMAIEQGRECCWWCYGISVASTEYTNQVDQ